jgi:DNA polymerase lambda
MKRLKYEESMESSVVTKLFSGIYGVGPMVARDWYSRGLRTLDDVKAKKGGIRLSPSQQVRASGFSYTCSFNLTCFG